MRIFKGIGATTDIFEKNGMKCAFSKKALEDLAKQINEKYIPFTVEHKPIYIGVLLCAKVRKIQNDKHGLFFVAGLYEYDDEKDFYPYETPNTIWKRYIHLLSEEQEYHISIYTGNEEIKKDLEKLLKSKGIETHHSVELDASPADIIGIALSTISLGIEVYHLLSDYVKKKREEDDGIEIRVKIVNNKMGRGKEINIKAGKSENIEKILKEVNKIN